MKTVSVPRILQQQPSFSEKKSSLAVKQQEAWEKWQKVGLPGPHLEGWKYTNLRGLNDLSAISPVRDIPSLPKIKEAATAVLVDGIFRSELSDLEGLPAGIIVKSLKQALKDFPDLNAGEYGQILKAAGAVSLEHALVNLNTAVFSDGLFVHVPSNIKSERPLHIILCGLATVRYPRLLVKIEENSNLEIIETSMGEGSGFTNLVMEVDIAKRSSLQHLIIQAESCASFHVAYQATRLAQNASYRAFVLQQGSRLARREMGVSLGGPEARATLDALLMGAAGNHLDLTSFVDHAAPQTLSDSVVRMVLGENARGIFQGKVLVRPDSQKVDGNQLAKALLLSRSAEADIKPELEIYADDVKCSHGAAVGELDEAQLFYLMSRGLSKNEARQLLIQAFFAEILERLPEGILRMAAEHQVSTWLSAAWKG